MPLEYAIALTGGIAVGKSTVINLLKLHGYHTIDADKIAHELLDTFSSNIVQLFGEQYATNGRVNRKQLGELVFNNKTAKTTLESFLHPKIRDEIHAQAYVREKRKFTYFIDIPLFFETQQYDIKTSLLIYTPKAVQVTRLMERDNLTHEQSLARISSQMDIEEKKPLATYIIDNTKDLKHLEKGCEEFMEIIKIK